MSKTARIHSIPATLILSLVLAMAGLYVYTGSFRVLAVVLAVGVSLLLLRRDLSILRQPAALLLLAYVLVAGASIFWAMSGKFFLREYTKIFLAGCIFLAVLLAKQFDRSAMRKLFTLLCTVSGIYAFLSVEYVSSGFSKVLLQALIPNIRLVNVAVETGTRITGIFGTPNATATMMALSILLGVYLMTTEENKTLRMLHAGILALNAFCFLLLFSMGATGFFALSLLVYLIADGKHRGVTFIGMLIGAVPSLVWAFASFPCFGAESALSFFPVVALAANVASVILLDRILSPKLIPVVEQRGKLILVVVAALIAAAAVYLVAAMNVGSAYTFGDSFRRSIYPDAGTHTLSVQADGEVRCTIISQNKAETIMHTSTQLYRGTDTEITFEVPEDSKVCYITFQAAEGVTLESALVDGSEKVILDYPLLPGFVANRLQGLWANENAIQRTEFFSDGMKVFRLSPIVGCGVGSFETACTNVQEFFYETKYIHNHYIQVLLECGVLGFIPFAGALACMVLLLLKKRREEEWTFRPEFAPLCACLVMILTHIAFEVSMSDVVVLCFIYAIFAALIRCCAPPAVAEPQTKKKGQRPKTTAPAIRAACMVLPTAFAVSVCCNLFANHLLQKPVGSFDEFMDNLSAAAKVDLYEKNDAKLSYVLASLQADNPDIYLSQSNQYAAELLQVQSNSIPKSLTQYYFATQQYDQALAAALAGASYSSTDAATWNDTLSILRGYLLNPMGTPLYLEDENIAPMFMAYYTALQQHNTNSMEDVALSLAGKDFFGKLRSVSESDGSVETVNAILTGELFHLDTACDANLDGIPDQISRSNLMQFQADGTIATQSGASMTLDLYTENIVGTAEVRVTCSDPASIVLHSVTGNLDIQGSADNGCATFLVPIFPSQDQTTSVQFRTSAEQTITGIDVTYLP